MILQNKVAIVTGGGYGIGRESCLEFTREGASVAIVDWNESTGKETLDFVREINQNVILIRADVSKPIEIERAISQTIEKFGRLDILFSNAGVNCFKSTLDTNEEDCNVLWT